MDFPIVTFPWFGSGTIIAMIAIIHVIINHGVAIGGSVYMVTFEYLAIKNNDQEMEQVARKYSKWILIITTTAGAMTGVGIWFSTMVIQPYAIGSLLRIFHWAWFTEWIVFVSEVILLLTYFYTWDKWTGNKKKWHLYTGIALCIASWLTMLIITAILAAQMTPGKWVETLSFWDAFINPTWLPSLLFRTFVALALAAAVLTPFIQFKVKDQRLKSALLQAIGKWVMVSIPAMFAFGLWYVGNLPEEANKLIVWASGMEKSIFTWINGIAILIFGLMAVWLVARPLKVPVILSVIVFVFSIGLIGEFEMVRETIRKPYVIYDYMYVNGIKKDQVETFQKEGFLPKTKWLGVTQVTSDNQIEAGQALFEAQCMSCHTVDGWRSKRAMTQRISGWKAENISSYVKNLHSVRYFMPPFAGNEEELKALGVYLESVTNPNAGFAQGGKK